MADANIKRANSITNNTSKFFKNVAGATSKVLDVAPRLTGAGDLMELEEIDAILNSIIVGITTIRGTYPFDPEFGLGLQLYLFEALDEFVIKEIEREIYTFIRTYEPRVDARVVVSPSRDPHTLTINLTLSYNGEDRSRKIVINDTLLKYGEDID